MCPTTNLNFNDVYYIRLIMFKKLSLLGGITIFDKIADSAKNHSGALKFPQN